MDVSTLLAGLDFSHSRLLGILETIEKSGQEPAKVLAWRPAPGRAHIGWQAMHCAATHDRYLNVHLKGAKPTDEALVAGYAGGTTPSDSNIPDLATIRSALERQYRQFRDFVAGQSQADFDRVVQPNRTLGQAVLLLTWHEAHHQGQIHLTWNMYKQAHGIS